MIRLVRSALRLLRCVRFGLACCTIALPSVALPSEAVPACVTESGNAVLRRSAGNGEYHLIATHNPPKLRVLDAQCRVLREHDLISRDRALRSPASALLHLPHRSSFVIAFETVPELWEISHDTLADEIPLGMIHDFQYREGSFVSGYLNPRRIELPFPATILIASDDNHEILVGRSRRRDLKLLNLDVRKVIGSKELDPAHDCSLPIAVETGRGPLQRVVEFRWTLEECARWQESRK